MTLYITYDLPSAPEMIVCPNRYGEYVSINDYEALEEIIVDLKEQVASLQLQLQQYIG